MHSSGTHVVDATMFWSRTGGGVRRYLEAKDRWLRRQGAWRHTIASPVADLPGMARVPAFPLPGSGGYRLPLDRATLARRLTALAPDVIEAGDPYRLAWAALDAAHALGIPALAFCHARFAETAARVARRYACHLYSKFDLVLAPSEAMRRHLLEWGVPRVARQPLGVNAQLFHPRRASRTWRARLGIADDTRLLVYAGRFAPEKHLDVLIEAVQCLGAPYLLLLIGTGPLRPQGERVRVLPHLRDARQLATALASADAFVHAGDQETFGLSVLEAMACGTPAVARAAEGLAELVDELVGIGVTQHALFAGDLAARSRAARERAEAHDWSRVLPLLLSHYRRLLNAPARSLRADYGEQRWAE
ncbi:MAG: glycosyltransferase family 1 protein [Betaproteobacteria bacterium]|nr:MAG: glycosyltransferase family 1 protein [Betaproteobacteria bacterium]